jgi:hypothetical protein
MAWYGRKQSVLLPDTPAVLAGLGQYGVAVDYVYFSPSFFRSQSPATVEAWVKQLGSPVRLPVAGEPLFPFNQMNEAASG